MKSNETVTSDAKTNTPRNLGFEAVAGDEFYFVSYNSNDCDRISPYAKQIHNVGIPLWYDKGLIYGKKWEEEIGLHIANSRAFILFFTKGILAKNESYVEKEFRIAKKQGKKIFILMIDRLDESCWREFPEKSSFLDDVDQVQSCSCESIDYLIEELKNDFQASAPTQGKTSTAPTPRSQSSTAPEPIKFTRSLPFAKPTIVDSETLLNNEYFTARELSERHVELDRLTVDAKLFPEALDIEGDADTWEDMVANTADCTGNLIVNNRIVGYMDFIPVSPESYDLLKTEPFSDDYVAFYSFGGEFDIYVSMFSIEKSSATQANCILFFQWMVNRIWELRERGIFINRIGFSIYSKQQAAALESLGCKLLLKNKLKGFLYETRAKELLHNEILSKIPTNVKISYETHTSPSVDIVTECNEIAEPLLARNGGILLYENAASESDAIITVKIQNGTAGYVCLKEYDVLPDGIYIEQIAVSEDRQGLGLGEQLIKKAIKYAKKCGYEKIYANCRKINEASRSLFESTGFVEFDMTEEQYLGIGIEPQFIEKNYAFFRNV